MKHSILVLSLALSFVLSACKSSPSTPAPSPSDSSDETDAGPRAAPTPVASPVATAAPTPSMTPISRPSPTPIADGSFAYVPEGSQAAIRAEATSDHQLRVTEFPATWRVTATIKRDGYGAALDATTCKSIRYDLDRVQSPVASPSTIRNYHEIVRESDSWAIALSSNPFFNDDQLLKGLRAAADKAPAQVSAYGNVINYPTWYRIDARIEFSDDAWSKVLGIQELQRSYETYLSSQVSSQRAARRWPSPRRIWPAIS